MERSRVWMEFRKELRRHALDLEEQETALQRAATAGDPSTVQRLEQEHAVVNAAFERRRSEAYSVAASAAREADRRWAKLSPLLVRASEIPTPITLGHFLRQFGQSDRREIDAFNRAPNITHSLALMNGDITRLILDEKSLLSTSPPAGKDQKVRLTSLYRAVLVRSPTPTESSRCLEVLKTSPTTEADIIWALINSPEFLFVQ